MVFKPIVFDGFSDHVLTIIISPVLVASRFPAEELVPGHSIQCQAESLSLGI